MGGPPVKLVAWVTAAAFVFGSAVLIGEIVNDEGSSDSGHSAAPMERSDAQLGRADATG